MAVAAEQLQAQLPPHLGAMRAPHHLSPFMTRRALHRGEQGLASSYIAVTQTQALAAAGGGLLRGRQLPREEQGALDIHIPPSAPLLLDLDQAAHLDSIQEVAVGEAPVAEEGSTAVEAGRTPTFLRTPALGDRRFRSFLRAQRRAARHYR